jgi:ketosteroid isomerase-like protein
MSERSATEQGNIERVTTYFNSISSGDVDRALDLLDDEGTWWSNQRRTDVPMRDFKPGSGATLKIMPFKFKIHSMVAVDDQVIAETESFATRPNGNPYNNVYCFIFTLDDGRIVRVREYADTVEAADLPPEIRSLNRH